DLTEKVKFGEDNELVIQVKDTHPVRVGGILGNVCLYKTLPFTRSEDNGIIAERKTENFSVILHLGDALLSKAGRTILAQSELSEIQVPPYILREDELILLLPANLIEDSGSLYKVELENVSSVRDERALCVRLGELAESVKLYDLMNIPIKVEGSYSNPFDPEQINVQAIFETPSGDVEKVAAFFAQDFTNIDVSEDEEILLPKKCNPWRLYYRPREVGVYKIELFAQDKTGIKRTETKIFSVAESTKRGFLRVSKRDPRFFEFDNGESFYGIGPSGWFRDENFLFGGNPRWLTTKRSDGYYERKSSHHSNYEYCLSVFFGQLYTKGGFIDQHVAWKAEHRIRTMERLGIYWIVVYDDLRRAFRYGFDNLAYSAAQGGVCNDLGELYFNERALRMQKDQLRYFISRVSDSPAIWIWNCGDEHQPGFSYSRLLVLSWLKELHSYIRQIDVYRHPHAIGEEYYSIVFGGEAVL
ncbi:unnamed protein product, partial [marine sediment metagenome]